VYKPLNSGSIAVYRQNK